MANTVPSPSLKCLILFEPEVLHMFILLRAPQIMSPILIAVQMFVFFSDFRKSNFLEVWHLDQ